jgi:hypothetical protein
MIPKKAPAAYAAALEEAANLYIERGIERSEVWRRSGVRGQTSHIMAKAERAFSQAMRGEIPNRDNYVDLINYAAFALVLIDEAGVGVDPEVVDVTASVLNGDWPWDG